ncbi:aspartate aminotransferase family protein [Aeoliella mucimassa]|uniref:Glutamate-1-semialdehyde 2,1-aminomutase n=1 Tax=Aeoliella mucimassa TaxID=2527972 RepID=A0A518AVD1_9BACT|nr:aspartate aminotransferase family protein [Aeoliella mucimassa]QDU58684.1 Glutamate-1-semialdehyde 2,1-aminomutase [Aeoliella mucimassa]
MNNMTWSRKALTYFPAGSNGEFNLPSDLATVVSHGEGCRLTTADGREMLDFSMGWGSVLVGHADARIVGPVAKRLLQGTNFATVTDASTELAEQIIAISPACDQVRFCASGTEATMYCLRLARAAQGKRKVLRFEGAYHGAHDVGVTNLFPTERNDPPQPRPSSDGLTAHENGGVLVAPFNDLEITTRIIQENKQELAAVIVEPLQRCLPPATGFLEGLRQVTAECGVLLVFDEVVTGFRLALGGAQEYYGVVPDLVAYGKALGGGLPIGVFGGRADLMELASESRQGSDTYVWTASTLGGNPISCTAALATLNILRDPASYEHLHTLGKYLRHGMRSVIDRLGVRAHVLGDGPLAQIAFTPSMPHDYWSSQHEDRQLARDLMLQLFRSGIFLNPMGTKLYLSLSHTHAACDELLNKLEESLDQLTNTTAVAAS